MLEIQQQNDKQSKSKNCLDRFSPKKIYKLPISAWKNAQKH